MRSKFIVTLFCTVLVMGLQAQSTTPAANAGIGSLIAQLANNISPTAFTPEFLKNKKGWMEKAQMTNDPKGATWLLKSLQGGLKPEAFTPVWNGNQNQWLASVNSIKTVKEAATQLSLLSANITPATMDTRWTAQSASWKTSVRDLAK